MIWAVNICVVNPKLHPPDARILNIWLPAIFGQFEQHNLLGTLRILGFQTNLLL
jgi:hypothetical protein